MQHAEMRGSLRVKCSSQGEYVEMKKKCLRKILWKSCAFVLTAEIQRNVKIWKYPEKLKKTLQSYIGINIHISRLPYWC